jgi:hypothetical protein
MQTVNAELKAQGSLSDAPFQAEPALASLLAEH